MRVLVTGAGGMLAQALVPLLVERGHQVVALGIEDLDVTRAGDVLRRFREERPEAVVQCAAYTQVDAAEADEATAFQVNAEATRHVAEACAELGAQLVYPSTDYVFPGTASTPYRPEDATSPVNAYGRSKLAGEQAALGWSRSLVVRTSWLYGQGGPNFVDTITRLARQRDRLEVVDDQVGRPTWTVSLATTLAELVEVRATGVLHATDGGEPVSWCGFAREILALQGIATPVVPVGSAAFPRPAARPGYSVLDCSATERTVGRPMSPWQEALRGHLAAVGALP